MAKENIMTVGEWRKIVGEEYANKLAMSNRSDNDMIDPDEQRNVEFALKMKESGKHGLDLVKEIVKVGGWRDVYRVILGVPYICERLEDHPEWVVSGRKEWKSTNEVHDVISWDSDLFITKGEELIGIGDLRFASNKYIHLIDAEA